MIPTSTYQMYEPGDWDEYLLYMSDHEYTPREISFDFKIHCPKIASYLHLMLDHINHEATIMSLMTQENMRGQGYATRLLQSAIKLAHETLTVDYISVDDCTDNFRKDHNIYINNGFKYVEKFYPEMVIRFDE